MLFADRTEAGQRLAEELISYRDRRPVVLALPRGGVPVGYEIAKQLNAPLDFLLVRKLGAPISPELAIGAIVDGPRVETFLNRDIIASLDVPQRYIDDEIARQTREIERRRKLYRGVHRPIDIRDHTAIVVDDGIATGATMRVALGAARGRHPARLVLAVPVAPASTIAAMRGEADDIVCLYSREDFGGIGFFYRDFGQVDDETVTKLLADAAKNLDRLGAPRRTD